ncbi:hypothetical protein BOX15_Mlig028287g1, partial [Macrostomum lignano]
RYTVEYTGGGGCSNEDGQGRSEPAFIRQFKQRAGILPDAKLADKFANSDDNSSSGKGLGKAKPRADSADEGREPAARNEEEMPQIVLSADSGISESELAVVQARIREAGEEAKFEEARSRVRFVRPAIGGNSGGSRKTKLGGGVISASSGSGAGASAADSEVSSAKRPRQQSNSATSGSNSRSSSSVCNKKLLSFDEEEGDD